MSQKTEQNIRELAAEAMEIIRRDFPNYNNWTANDLAQLPDSDIWSIRTAVAKENKELPGKAVIDIFLPEAFTREYGANARAVFMHGILQEARARDQQNTVFEGLVRGVVTKFPEFTDGKFAGLSETQKDTLKLNERTKVKYDDGQIVDTTPPEMLAREMAVTFYARNNPKVTIPDAVMDAVIDANPKLLPQALKDILGANVYNVTFTDEAACDVGNSMRVALEKGQTAGLVFKDDKGLQYDPQKMSANGAAFVAKLYDPTAQDWPPQLAFKACWAMADMDIKNNNAAHDVLFGQPAGTGPRIADNNKQR